MKISLNIIFLTFKKLFVRYFNFIAAASFVIILFLGYQYVVLPVIQNIKVGGTANLRVKEKEIEALSRYLQELKEMKSEFESVSREDLDRLNQILPSEKDIPGLMVQLQRIAQKNKLFLQNISFSTSETASSAGGENERTGANPENGAPGGENSGLGQEDSLRELRISFSVSEGDYEALKKFLSDIETNMRIFDVYDIRFGNTQEGPYAFNLITYYISE